MTTYGHVKVLVLKPMWKQADKNSKAQAMTHIHKTKMKQADMTSKGYAKAVALKPIEETSRHGLERG